MSIKPCDEDVFKNGQSVCLVDIPKETAENICQSLSAATGVKIDWHYIGGRVHIKALAVLAQEAGKVEPVAWVLMKDGKPDYEQEIVISNLPGDEFDGEGTWNKVYTSPPAPVSVVEITRSDFSDQLEKDIDETGNYLPGASREDLYDRGYRKIGRLDKVKELNQ